MVNYSAPLDDIFGALTHPIRREILARLRQGEASVTELAAPFNISLPAMLKHVGILERVGLLSSKKAGRVHTCRLNAVPLQEAAEWLGYYEKFWNDKFDALDDFLQESNESNSP